MEINNIIGDGFIGKSLYKIKKDLIKTNYIIYAAGISHSKTKSKRNLNKELSSFKIFLKNNLSKKVIYISTADVTNSISNKSLYVKNKIKIEKLIKKRLKNYIILRLPQIIGKSKNKNTLVNYFYFNIKNNKPLVLIKNFKRNVLDIADILKLIKIIVYSKKTKNKVIILSNKYSVQPIDIVKIFEKKLNKIVNFKFKKIKKQIWPLYYQKNAHYFRKAKITFDRNYLLKTINKYY
jgi:nucleoside-diphosphate-sugar epimerase